MRNLKKLVLGRSGASFGAKIGGIGVAAGVGLVASPAHGALTLSLSEPGFATLMLTDTTSTGEVSYFGTYGDFSTNFIVGLSNRLTPTPGLAQLQVQSLDVTSNAITSAKTLTILVSDSGYTFPGLSGQSLLMTSSLGGTLTLPAVGDTVTFKSTATPNGGPAITSGVQTYTSTTAPVGTVSFTVPTAQTTFPVPVSYGLSDQIVATFTNPGETDNLSGSTTVALAPAPIPEPAGIAGVAVASLSLLSRRRRLA